MRSTPTSQAVACLRLRSILSSLAELARRLIGHVLSSGAVAAEASIGARELASCASDAPRLSLGDVVPGGEGARDSLGANCGGGGGGKKIELTGQPGSTCSS